MKKKLLPNFKQIRFIYLLLKNYYYNQKYEIIKEKKTYT